ncbi:PP2C family serine/threonine-protein phosphatase [Endozoicomonas ascidiicola]|uniref:PP2C family serine/threonine-protein phosphatase n=1 Tax=Endozoicomonas ascidiicola TaxID=1698521 RepID=UPI00082B0714|nr:PP2C family serine/threonine-protein phosphatase [Endozoicomonas ascidiicola]USN26995.1 protein phosphatase 2C domain-containing protein [synthetic construct]
MGQTSRIPSAEVRTLVSIFQHEPDERLIQQLLEDSAFCSFYSGIKSMVLQHIEQIPPVLDAVQSGEGTDTLTAIADTSDQQDSNESMEPKESIEQMLDNESTSESPQSEFLNLCSDSNSSQSSSSPQEQGDVASDASNLSTTDANSDIPDEQESAELSIVAPIHEADEALLSVNVDSADENPSADDSVKVDSSDHSSISLVKESEVGESNAMKHNPPDLQLVQERETVHVNMPNGMCGREYSQIIQLANLHVEDSRIPDELGLQFDKGSNCISGIPKQAGDFEIRFQGYLSEENSSSEQTRKDVFVISRFTINPDPRSLWKDVESDSQAKFHKPDFDSSSLDVEEYRMIAASQRGRSHAHKGTHRDDEAGIKYLPESGWHILVVADGAGSCQYSRRGSQLAITFVLQHLTDELNGEVGKQLEAVCLEREQLESGFDQSVTQALHQTLVMAAWKAAKGIESEAKHHDLSVKDFSTTLLILIYKKTEKGHLILSFSVGDGAIAAYSKEGGVDLLCTPDSGEFAGQTRFLDGGVFKQPDVYQRIKACLLPDFTALMAMTDGITDARFETESMLSESAPWQALWMELEPLLKGSKEDAEKAVLDWLNFWSPGNHDDRSIAFLAGIDRND